MKLITFKHMGQLKIGAVLNESHGVDFSMLNESIPPTMLGLIENHQYFLPILNKILSEGGVKSILLRIGRKC